MDWWFMNQHGYPMEKVSSARTAKGILRRRLTNINSAHIVGGSVNSRSIYDERIHP